MNKLQKTGYFILLFIFFLIGVVIITIIVHKQFYPFWSSQPVAWTSILSVKEGIIVDNPLQISCSKTVPEFMKIQKLTVPNRYKERIHFIKRHQIYWSSITKLLTNNGMDNHSTFTPNYISLNLSYPDSTIYCIIFGNKVIGMLHKIPIMVDTPFHKNLPCQWLDYLCVNKKYRGNSFVSKNIATILMEHAICDSSYSKPLNTNQNKSSNKKDKIPIGLFMTEKILPFPHVAQFTKMISIMQPALLPDQNIQTVYKIVNSMDNLPSKAYESSDIRIHGGATLEPSSNIKYKKSFWEFVIYNPYHTVLSIHGEDWIHIQRFPNEKNVPVFALNGFSCKNDSDIVLHVMHFLSTQKYNEIKFVVKAPIHELFKNKLQWEIYDVHYLYFYNYRLNRKSTHIPNTWNIS